MTDGDGTRGGRPRRFLRAALFVGGLLLLAGPALAHGGSMRGAAGRQLAVPTWLFLLTGGGAISGSFLLASFVTDRAFVRSAHEWGRSLSVPVAVLGRYLARPFGLAVLALVLFAGFAGPPDAISNAATLVVWVGWWAGFAVSTYLVGNAWPALNPWRTLADLLPSLERGYPERLGAWPSVAGLLALVWLEVVSPLGDRPRLLASAVLAYTLVTLLGAVAFGTERWFSTVDPVARVFRYYGRVAPIQRTDDGLRLTWPGGDLTAEGLVDGDDEVAFVVALLWATTFDGLVWTPAWSAAVAPALAAGVPAVAVYLVAIVAGFGLFLGIYRLAARRARETAPTYLRAGTLARRFAPALLPIAAGYHLAHYLGDFLALSPTLAAVAVDPLTPPAGVVLVLPAWFGGLELWAVLLGHLLAIWVAHAIAYREFPGRLQAVRSQYPFIAAMVLYTMVSLWIVSRPEVTPPGL